jgi:L-lactate dehydrogenase (cytochrome)
VSNHGGNNLDGTPASIRALPTIAAAVGSQVEVLLDGGIRRGSDVVKAVALGARAVMIGRAYLWGLAANGQAGVENVLDILRGGIDSALAGLGHGSVHDLGPDDILVPAGFTRALGVPAQD